MPHYGMSSSLVLGKNFWWKNAVAHRGVDRGLDQFLGCLSILQRQIQISGEDLAPPVPHHLDHESRSSYAVEVARTTSTKRVTRKKCRI